MVLDALFDSGNQMVIYGTCPHHGSQRGMLVASADSSVDAVSNSLCYIFLKTRGDVAFLALVSFSLFLIPLIRYKLSYCCTNAGKGA